MPPNVETPKDFPISLCTAQTYVGVSVGPCKEKKSTSSDFKVFSWLTGEGIGVKEVITSLGCKALSKPHDKRWNDVWAELPGQRSYIGTVGELSSLQRQVWK